MKKCNKCGIKITDETVICPLCQNVLDDVEEENTTSDVTASEIGKTMYPQIEFNMHKFNIIFRLFLFLSIILSALLITVNYLTYSGVWWALISIGAIVYMWLTVFYSIRNDKNSAMKIVIQTLFGQLLTLLIDWSIGYSGWSINYAIPCIFMVANLAVLILMLVNFTNWQSYIMFQIIFVAFGFILIIFSLVKLITHPMLTFIAFGCSIVILSGTLIFGERSAKNELQRRFHL